MNAPLLIDRHIDARLAILARAAARFELVQAGAMDIGEAFDGLIASLQCACDRDRIQRWERQDQRRRTHFKKGI
jgi:hypothetical protein